MLEIISPAGSPEGVVAAVQNGADAIYLGYKSHNSCLSAENFTPPELGRALEYCRVRGVKTYLALDASAFDRDLAQISELAGEASRLGVDAIIVGDLGVMMAVRRAAPDVPLHAAAQLNIHNLEGVKMAAAMGFKRVILARELSRKKLSYICRNTSMEVAIYAHGRLCISYCGQCYMSAVTTRRSANRGMCAEPCRLSYSFGEHSMTHPLSLKDNCLVRYTADIEAIGVRGIMLEGLDKRPEYAAIATGIYSKAAQKGKSPTQDEMRVLREAFSRQGLTDAYYTGRQDRDMLGEAEESSGDSSVILATTRKNYLNGEFQRVPVRFVGSVREGKRAKLAAMDDRKNSAVVYGPIPLPAFHSELTITSLQTQLHKTGGTPFHCIGVKGSVEPGLALPMSAFNDMRRSLLTEILEQRKPPPVRSEGKYVAPEYSPGRDSIPILTVSVTRMDQLSKAMEELCPGFVYIPIMEFQFDSPVLRGFLENSEITVAASLPRVIHDNERKRVSEMLLRAADHGVSNVLVGNIGHIQFARGHGMAARGDFGLNVMNSESLYALRNLGLKSATLSFELRLSEIREISKPIDAELIVYGRMPLMLTENCVIKNSTGACTCENFSGFLDKDSNLYPIVPEFGCRNVLLSPKKLYMADKRRFTAAIGLWAERLSFTTENALECVSVMKRYMGLSDREPQNHTRGLYYRGVEQ